MMVESRKDMAGLWLRLVGFALVPLAVQMFQPAIGGVLSLVAPLPLAYGMARRGYLEGTAAVSFVGMMTSVFLGAGQGMIYLLETLPLCVGIRWTVRSTGPLYRPVIRTVALIGLVVLAATLVFSALTGLTPGELYTQASQSMGLLMDEMTVAPELSVQDRQRLEYLTDTTRRLFVGIWLATLLLLVTFFSLLIRGWMVSAGLMEDEGSALLAQWRLPFPFVFGFMAVASVVLLAAGTARDVALNALVPLGTLYGIQGIVVAGHMFTRWMLPSFFRILILAFGLMLYQLGFMVTIALLGLFDTWIDFRRRWPLETPPPPVT